MFAFLFSVSLSTLLAGTGVKVEKSVLHSDGWRGVARFGDVVWVYGILVEATPPSFVFALAALVHQSHGGGFLNAEH